MKNPSQKIIMKGTESEKKHEKKKYAKNLIKTFNVEDINDQLENRYGRRRNHGVRGMLHKNVRFLYAPLLRFCFLPSSTC